MSRGVGGRWVRPTHVAPAGSRASRSHDGAAAASPDVAKVFTVTGMISPPLSCGLPQMTADRLETGLIDLFADHFGDLRRLRRSRGKARLPMPKRPVTVGDRQQADMRGVVEHPHLRVPQAIGGGLLEI